MRMFLILRVGPIYPVIMDQFEYIKILKEVMLPYAEEEMPWKWVFQQNDDPKHNNKQAASLLLLFSHLAEAFIESDLQISKSNYNYKLKLYKYYKYTHLRKLRN